MPELKSVVLVTTKQPSSNPRLVKEAMALAGDGYKVTVLYNFWSSWAEEADKIIVQSNSAINWIKVGSDPVKSKITYLYTRVRHKCYRLLAGFFSNSLMLQVQAATQFYPELKSACANIKASLYIAHNVGALAVAAAAAKKHNSQYAFDAEDFHRAQDNNNYKERDSVHLIETEYFPGAAFITAASPLIAMEYKKYYPAIDFTIVNNVFSATHQPAFVQLTKTPFKLFWFSQTVGLKRGLQDVLYALNCISNFAIEFTIVGDVQEAVKQTLQQILTNNIHTLSFVAPCNEQQLMSIASHQHIGLALEPGFSVNNNIALSNKLFTYLLCGNAVILSATPAQKMFYDEYPQVGYCYTSGDIDSLVSIIQEAYNNEALINTTRQYCWQLAHDRLNWETEKEKFLTQVKKVI